MGVRRILLPWDRQPQEAADVDWSNPLTHGLVFLAPLRYGQLDDIVGGKRATVTGTLGSVATSDGVFPLFSGTQYIDYGAFGAEFPAGPATVAWIQTPIAQSGFSAAMNFKPSGGVNSFLVYQNGGGGSYAFTFGRNTGTGAANYNTTVGAPTNGNTRRFLLRSPSLDTATYTDYSLFDGLSGALAPDGAAPYGGSTATGMRVGAVLSSAGDKFDGAIGMLAIWRRELSDIEARSYNSNPWQLFAPQTIWVPVSAGGSSTVDLAATAAAQSTATAALLKGVDLTSAALSVSTGTAGMSLAVNLAGSAQAVASATGGLQVTVNLAAGGLAAAVATAALAIGKPLAADGQGQASATADLSTSGSVTLAADAQAVASAGAEFAGAVTLAADAIAQAQATAALSVGKPLAAAAQAQASSGATITLQVPLGAAALAQAASTANLSLSVNLSAAAFGQATATAALPTLVELAASGLAMATASAALTVTAVNTTLGSLVGRLGRTVSSRPAAISNQVRHNRQTSSRR